MKIARGLFAALLAAPALLADLTVEQKLSDFMNLVGLYSKNYAPYELKRDLYGFDLYRVQPWVDQIRASKTDPEFFDICTRYVASLRDSHDEYITKSSYDAWLHFDADIYDGKLIIDYIDRRYLPSATYNFTYGDELISVDGVPVAELITKFEPYAVNGASNPVSRRRLAAATITERYQAWYPLAHMIDKEAVVVIRRASTDAEQTYTIKWDVYGEPVTSAGIVPSPVYVRKASKTASERRGETPVRRRAMRYGPALGIPSQGTTTVDTDTPDVPAPTPEYMKPLEQLQHFEAVAGPQAFGEGSGLGPFGYAYPLFVYSLPNNFRYRLGFSTSDYFFSGTFTSGGKTYGLLRIATMSPANTTAALAQLATEIQYLEANTDGLILDLMGNGGGSLCYTQSIARMLVPSPFMGFSEELRATLQWQGSFASALTSARRANAEQWIIDSYQYLLDQVKAALKENRARTGALPLCGYDFPTSSFFDAKGVKTLYTKPILTLVDNFTLSAGESLTMVLQDNRRATVMGTTTDGGGGNVVSFDAGGYAEGTTRMTMGLLVRLNPVAVDGFPAIRYYDGVGIQPDIYQDYMTMDNFDTDGAVFWDAALSALRGL